MADFWAHSNKQFYLRKQEQESFKYISGGWKNRTVLKFVVSKVLLYLLVWGRWEVTSDRKTSLTILTVCQCSEKWWRKLPLPNIHISSGCLRGWNYFSTHFSSLQCKIQCKRKACTRLFLAHTSLHLFVQLQLQNNYSRLQCRSHEKQGLTLCLQGWHLGICRLWQFFIDDAYFS